MANVAFDKGLSVSAVTDPTVKALGDVREIAAAVDPNTMTVTVGNFAAAVCRPVIRPASASPQIRIVDAKSIFKSEPSPLPVSNPLRQVLL